MNDYATQKWNRAEKLRALMVAVAAHLPGEPWEVQTLKRDADGWPPHWLSMTEAGEGERLAICAEYDEHKNRVEFSLSGWPKYIGESGSVQQVTTADLWGEFKADTPRTTAAAGRPAEAIAKQVIRNVLEPGREIWANCQKIARDRQRFADTNNHAFDLLAAELGDDTANRSRRCVYNRNIPGHVGIEFRGASSVKLEVEALEAVELLKQLRKIRQAAERAAA